jgi:Cft2 family RNA processing exonuclease
VLPLKIRVLGAAKEVGGSCISVETDRLKVALDYGIKLEGITDQYPKNFNAIIISHAHLDHTGSLLRLGKTRNPQLILGSRMTRDVTAELLKDMIKVQETQGNPEGFELATVDKVKDTWWSPSENAALPGMNVEFYPAGHVAGAKLTALHAEDKTMLYTGDFCLHESEILEGSNLQGVPKEPDMLISESTYGGTIRPPRKQLTDQFLKRLASLMKRRQNILIPIFAFHRSQEMAKRIDDAIDAGVLPRYNVYEISPLAQRITAQFNANRQLFTPRISEQQQPFTYKHVKNLERTSDIETPAVALCTPGFGHAGASLSLLTDWGESEDTTVILTSGYLPPTSPLRLAKEKRQFKLADGEKINVAAHFETIELSGHADQLELVELVTKLKPKKTLLMHGDLKQAELLAEKLGMLTEVSIAEKGELFTV